MVASHLDLRKVRIYGVGFLSVPGAVIIRFTGVNGKSMEVQGSILDDEVVECSTPKAWIQKKNGSKENTWI